MQLSESVVRREIHDTCAQIRRMDDTIKIKYSYIAEYEASVYNFGRCAGNIDIAQREMEIQDIMQRRGKLALKLCKLNKMLNNKRQKMH